MTSVGGFSLIGVLVLLWVDLSKAFTELATTVPVGEAEMRQDADEIEDEDSQSWKIPVILISTVAVTVLLVSVTVIGCYMAYPYIKKGIGKRKPKEKILPDVEIAEKGTEQEEKEEEEEDDEEMPETTPGNEEREPSEKPVKQVRMQQTIIPAAPSLLSTKMDETQKSRKPPKMRKAPKPRMRNVRVDDAASLALSDRDGSGGFKSAGRFGKASSHTPQDTLPKPQAEAKGYQAAPEKWMAAEQLPEPAQTNLAPTVRVFHRP